MKTGCMTTWVTRAAPTQAPTAAQNRRPASISRDVHFQRVAVSTDRTQWLRLRFLSGELTGVPACLDSTVPCKSEHSSVPLTHPLIIISNIKLDPANQREAPSRPINQPGVGHLPASGVGSQTGFRLRNTSRLANFQIDPI